ncbi:g6474 [Coccomyxa viridis]|uniref:G6474 protein n=1 Tax=Coccomyxa viridis TaxID=1274662 RepID=A0ABP1FXY5_9CHLO
MNRNQKSLLSQPLLEELHIGGTRQLSKPSSQQKAGQSTSGHERVPWLYVADARHAHADVIPFTLFDRYKLNVDYDEAGIGGSEPQDPEYPRLKPVGVYPVEGGWARIRLEDVAGKGEEGYSALYVVPGFTA